MKFKSLLTKNVMLRARSMQQTFKKKKQFTKRQMWNTNTYI